eukprot:732080-Pleurochrysis_carterae.AAC.1
MPLVGGADLNGTAFGDPNDLRFNHPYRASPTGLIYICVLTRFSVRPRVGSHFLVLHQLLRFCAQDSTC